MDHFDEILDCMFGVAQIINEKGPAAVNIENIHINKEYGCLVKSGFSHLLNGARIKNILWSGEIIYYIMNHSDITQHEIQEILLMEEVMALFQNGPAEQLQELLQQYGSYELTVKYGEWLERLTKSQNR